MPTKQDIEEEKKQGCKFCPEAVRRTLATMLDISLLKSPSFVLLSISGAFTMMGFYVPFMYLTERAEYRHMHPSFSMWLVSTIGIANTIGRVICGVLSSVPKVNTLAVNNVAMTIGGIATMASGLSSSDWYQFSYAVVFGLAICPLICAMINRWGYRIVAFTGGVLAALAFIASSFAPNIGILILTYGLLGGIGFGMLYMPSVIAIGFYFEKWRGVANSVSLCGSAVGSITIPIIISVSMKELIWRNKFRCFSGFTLFCAMCTLLYKPLQPLEIRIDQPPENVSDDESDDDIFPYKSVKNKLNNQTFQKMSTQASIYSIRRAGSPNAMSAFSFKSYASTTRSVFKGSRMSHDSEEGWFATCCNCENFKHTFKLLCCCCQRCGANPARPMYRDDILYAGSVANLKEYNDKSIMDPMDYHISMTRVASEKDLREDLKCCTICPTTVRRPLATIHTCQLFVTAMIFSLKPILIVELFGIEKLSNSFGILMMFYGMACLLGIPIGGLMHDMTNSYIVSFLFAGVSIILSGLLLSSVPSILHKEKKRAHRRRRKLEQLKSQAAHSSKHAADASTAPTQTN
ncbi:monocarboxylate transporter [Holotrichia oblita]|uniref:Monocarboxylate transporter n=1 Tax=Holotrichia oblita TaxID=644536 RepID=A0ACB9SV03_HOLOL|nr:monocarboxylate transporter [Holotrichia oblita]